MGWCWGLGEMSGGGPPKCCPGSRMLGSWRLGPDLQEGEERNGEEKQILSASWICGEMICWMHVVEGGGLGTGYRAGDPSVGPGWHRLSLHTE